MVGEPPPRRRLFRIDVRRVALRPGDWVVYDRDGRRFTTADDEGYAERLAERLGGTCEKLGEISEP